MNPMIIRVVISGAAIGLCGLLAWVDRKEKKEAEKPVVIPEVIPEENIVPLPDKEELESKRPKEVIEENEPST